MDSFEKRLEKDILQDHITALYAPRIIAEVGFFFLYKQHAHAEIVTVTDVTVSKFFTLSSDDFLQIMKISHKR